MMKEFNKEEFIEKFGKEKLPIVPSGRSLDDVKTIRVQFRKDGSLARVWFYSYYSQDEADKAWNKQQEEIEKQAKEEGVTPSFIRRRIARNRQHSINLIKKGRVFYG